MKFIPTRAVTVIGAALVLMIGGAVAYAQIPATDGTITGCVLKSSGQVRIIDTAKESCRSTETTVPWNQAGQPGTNGTNGVSGYQIVSRSGSLTGNSLVGSSGVLLGCPAGKVALGGFGDAHLVRSPVNLPVDVSGTFLSSDDEGVPEVAFRISKLDGSPFVAADVVEYVIQVTCAVMAS